MAVTEPSGCRYASARLFVAPGPAARTRLFPPRVHRLPVNRAWGLADSRLVPSLDPASRREPVNSERRRWPMRPVLDTRQHAHRGLVFRAGVRAVHARASDRPSRRPSPRAGGSYVRLILIMGLGPPERGRRGWQPMSLECARRGFRLLSVCSLLPSVKGERHMDAPVYPPPRHELSNKRQKLASETEKAFRAFSKQVFADGALNGKTKQIIAVAVAHVTQCPYCIRNHTKAALRAGAGPRGADGGDLGGGGDARRWRICARDHRACRDGRSGTSSRRVPSSSMHRGVRRA